MLQILYIEDHLIFGKQVVDHILHDHHVDWVTSLSQAKQQWLAHAERYDVILCDYDLPQSKGCEFVRLVRHQGRSTPVVAVSAHDAGNEALMEAGANVVCQKRMIPSALLSTIEALMAAHAKSQVF